MRVGKINRATNETKVDVEINLDGTGNAEISSGGRFKSGGTAGAFRNRSTTVDYHRV